MDMRRLFLFLIFFFSLFCALERLGTPESARRARCGGRTNGRVHTGCTAKNRAIRSSGNRRYCGTG